MSSLAVVHDTAPRQSRPSMDLRTTVEDLSRRHRRAGPDKLAEMLVTVLSEDADLLLQASHFIVEKIGAAIDAQVRRREAAERRPSRAARRVAEKAIAEQVVEKVAVAVLDLPIVLLSGETKQLRFTTGAELAGLGSAYTRLAAAVPADVMLGEVLDDQQAAELWGSAS
jgi:hypothetical protein